MARFGFESPSIHGVHHFIARAQALSYPAGRGLATMTLTAVNREGEAIDIDVDFDGRSIDYARDLADAINRVAEKHCRLTADERAEIFEDGVVL